mgnify:CR=1 FL=1
MACAGYPTDLNLPTSDFAEAAQWQVNLLLAIKQVQQQNCALQTIHSMKDSLQIGERPLVYTHFFTRLQCWLSNLFDALIRAQTQLLDQRFRHRHRVTIEHHQPAHATGGTQR